MTGKSGFDRKRRRKRLSNYIRILYNVDEWSRIGLRTVAKSRFPFGKVSLSINNIS